jgi:hypothetical protein
MITRNTPHAAFDPAMSPSDREPQTKLEAALEQIANIVSDGVEHGFFEIRIHGEIGRNQRRELVIQSGKSHKFFIPVEELSRG